MPSISHRLAAASQSCDVHLSSAFYLAFLRRFGALLLLLLLPFPVFFCFWPVAVWPAKKKKNRRFTASCRRAAFMPRDNGRIVGAWRDCAAITCAPRALSNASVAAVVWVLVIEIAQSRFEHVTIPIFYRTSVWQALNGKRRVDAAAAASI